MACYQEMIERRKLIAKKLYDIVYPALKALAADKAAIADFGMSMKDLISATKYAMELDLEVAGMEREDTLAGEYGTDDDRAREAERLLAEISGRRKKPSKG